MSNCFIDFIKKNVKEIEKISAVTKLNNYKNINLNFIRDDLKQSRIITGDVIIKKKRIKLINIYVPNGNPINTENSQKFKPRPSNSRKSSPAPKKIARSKSN